MARKFRYFLNFNLLSVLFYGCLGTRYLKPGEKQLYKQEIKVPKGFQKEGMSDLYVQKTNRRVLGLPINSLVWMYYIGERRYDPEKYIKKRETVEKKFDRKIKKAKVDKRKSAVQYKKQRKIDLLNKKIEEGNLFMQWGEKAAVYDSNNVISSNNQLAEYLFTRGYFDAKVEPKIITYDNPFKRRLIAVDYNVNPKGAYFYDSLSFNIEDRKLDSLIRNHEKESLIKKGDQFNQDILNKERERIDFLLKDHGYFDFSRKYVDFDIDSTFGGRHQIALRLNVINPTRSSKHKQFKIDSIIFITDTNKGSATSDRAKRQIRPYRDITYQYFENEYSKRILSQRIFLHQDSLYSRSNTINTQRQLANLSMFKIVNINYDTSDGKFIANLFSSSLNKYSWSNEVGLTVSQGYPGPYYNMNLLKRNLFGGLEIFELLGRAGFEGVASATDADNIYRSVEAGLNTSVTFPKFLFPLNENTSYNFAKFNPKTKFSIGYTFSDRPEYTRKNTNFSFTYSWQNERTTQYSLTIANLSIIQSDLDDTFRLQLEQLQSSQGNNILLSFNPSFVSSMIFSMTWNPENYGNSEKSSKFLRFSAESGGTLLNLYTPAIVDRNNLQLFKYIRLNVDYRKNQIIDKNTVLAYRFKSGIGYGYGEGRVLPYEKYFFAGGSNSLRAWKPRRLGLGSSPPLLSLNPTTDGLFDYSFEKPGEILLEGSVELRKKLFGFVSGALFIDWGNVWSFRENQANVSPSEPGLAPWTGTTKFQVDKVLKEIAVGTGFGLRFDFSFLILRFDMGIKVYDPAREEGNRFVLNKLKFFKPFNSDKEPVIYNIGIGYPF